MIPSHGKIIRTEAWIISQPVTWFNLVLFLSFSEDSRAQSAVGPEYIRLCLMLHMWPAGILMGFSSTLHDTEGGKGNLPEKKTWSVQGIINTELKRDFIFHFHLRIKEDRAVRRCESWIVFSPPRLSSSVCTVKFSFIWMAGREGVDYDLNRTVIHYEQEHQLNV